MANAKGQGRKPLPTNLKIIRNTLEKSRANLNEPQPDTDQLEMPAGMTLDAEQQWERIKPLLVEANVLTNVDTQALRMLCEVFAQWIEANKQLNEKGLLIVTKTGAVQQNPYFSVADRLHKRVLSLLAEFGMTPSSRTRVSTVEKGKPDNGFDDL